jgi:cyclopropane-fatty-acyl-phospholipid synthase
MKYKDTAAYLLGLAGVKINGDKPYDIQVHNEKFYRRVLGQRELGFGESYMDGWWDAAKIDELVNKILAADLLNKVKITPTLARTLLFSAVANKMPLVLNEQTKTKAKKNASFHYNIGNDLYERMLDKRMIYSCAYWKDSKTLDEAQEAKLDLICRKLHLKKGMSLLDIGCGWGGLAIYAANKYGVTVTGISPAKEQVKLAKQKAKGLNVKILQKDYRDITGKYDRIVSVGMLEHVGPKNYKKFFNICKIHLKDDGIMLHHTIGINLTANAADPWISKYIFPGGVIPSLSQITKAVEKRLVIEDIHNIGPDYDKTLMHWHDNFVKHYSEIKDKYDERFYRMWTYYLLSSAGAFRSRHLQLWQIVFRKIQPSDKYIPSR